MLSPLLEIALPRDGASQGEGDSSTGVRLLQEGPLPSWPLRSWSSSFQPDSVLKRGSSHPPNLEVQLGKGDSLLATCCPRWSKGERHISH